MKFRKRNCTLRLARRRTILFSRDGWFDPSRTKAIQTPTSKFVLVSSRGRDCSSTLTSTNGTDVKRGPQEAGRKESPANSRFEDDMLSMTSMSDWHAQL